MKVILINGSPHAEGSTYTALTVVASALMEQGVESEIFHIGTNNIPGCKGCFACRELGWCAIDDSVNKFAESVKRADGIIIGSPVYFSSPNASLLAFLDRLYAAHGAALMYKPCGCIVTANRAGTSAALDVLHKYPMVNEQPLVSSSYWCMVYGNTPEEIRADKEGMAIAYRLGHNMAWLVKALRNMPVPAKGQENVPV